MRRLCHISFSSHEETMFRSESDINFAFNCFALACLETESRPLADAEMTTHTHFGVATDSPSEVISKYRYRYTRYFNYKYRRHGSLGEQHPFILEVDGLQHTQAMLSYVFRQGLHHGLSSTPFGYKHNSVNVVFREELGKKEHVDILPRSRWRRFLPHCSPDIPSRYRMNRSGMFLREDVIDSAYVEEVFVSPRNFLYQMNRLSSEKWEEEQSEDGNGLPPVNLVAVEPICFRQNISQILNNETGRNARNGITDLELCQIIDTNYVQHFGAESIYDLTSQQRSDLGNLIYRDIRSGRMSDFLMRNTGIPDTDQIKRCTVIH